MRIDSVVPPTTNPPRAVSINELLPVGRVIDAVVAGRRSDTVFQLVAGTLKLAAESNRPLREGAEVKLIVTGRDTGGRPQLQVLPNNSQLIATELKTLLPRQQSPATLLSTLSAAVTQLPAATAAAAGTLLQAIPPRDRLTTGPQLRQALQQSGPFLESGLAKGQAPRNDLKHALLTVLQNVKRDLGELPAETRPQAARAAAPPPVPATPPAPPASSGSPERANTGPTGTPSTASGNNPAAQTGPSGNKSAAAPTPATTNNTLGNRPPTSPANNPLVKDTASRPPDTLGGFVRTGPGEPKAQPTPTAPDALRQRFQASGAETAAGARDANLPGKLQPQGRPEPTLPTMDMASRSGLEQLARLTEGSLSRLESLQLQHVQARDSGQQIPWLVELPIKDKDGVDIWQLQFDREQESSNQKSGKGRVWQVSLSFDFPGSGPVVARIRLQGDAVDVEFFTAQAGTGDLIERHGEELRQALARHAINDVSIQTQTGLPEQQSPLHGPLLEEKA